MIKYVITLLFSVSLLNAQDNIPTDSLMKVTVGDVLEIGKSETYAFKHIKFPRVNFISKKGGLANYNSVEGYKVVVTAVKEKKNGTTQVKIKRADGKQFFGSHTVVAANFNKAVASGELKME